MRDLPERRRSGVACMGWSSLWLHHSCVLRVDVLANFCYLAHKIFGFGLRLCKEKRIKCKQEPGKLL